MSTEIQEGIYYRSKPQIGNSFCLVSLRAKDTSQISEIGRIIGSIWHRLSKLKMGITVDLNVARKHRKTGNLTVLVGYGPKLFDLSDSKRKRPANFGDHWNFRQPELGGGGDILNGAGISYSKQIRENHLLLDHVVFQFIADNDFYTNRAAVELWKEIRRHGNDRDNLPLNISRLYSGYQRADYRGWLGFHEGVSNLKSRERPKVISIDARNVNPRDKWTSNGTYLAFIRIGIDLEKWEDTTIKDQEVMIGREKLTGCPLIGFDKYGKPIKDFTCPVPGTSEIIDRGNERFRDIMTYDMRTRSNNLEQSHIASTRPLDRVSIADRRSSRIYRQGFEFLDSSGPPGFAVGLNFVSFQNSPERLFRSLTSHKPPKKLTPFPSDLILDKFLYVLAAGIFFAPPVIKSEPFPGATIFFSVDELRNPPITKTSSASNPSS